MEYLIAVPWMFRGKAAKEINFNVSKEFEDGYMLGSSGDKEIVLKNAKNSIFIHNIFPVQIKKDNFNLESLGDLAKEFDNLKILKKSKSFAIETAAYRSEVKTRDFEVKFGQKLESLGYSVDLNKPEQIVYAFLHDKEVYLGCLNKNEVIYRYLDNSKVFSKIKNRLNRAQYKLVEALDRFNMNIDDGLALDIGAAPGGWTTELLNHGFKVYAIDPANLDDSLERNENVIHIKDKIENVDFKGLQFDVIVNDMNSDPVESAKIMVDNSKYLKKGGLAIMTAKLVTKNVDRFIKDVLDIIKDEYFIKTIKHLQQNRQEITFILEKNKVR